MVLSSLNSNFTCWLGLPAYIQSKELRWIHREPGQIETWLEAYLHTNCCNHSIIKFLGCNILAPCIDIFVWLRRAIEVFQGSDSQTSYLCWTIYDILLYHTLINERIRKRLWSLRWSNQMFHSSGRFSIPLLVPQKIKPYQRVYQERWWLLSSRVKGVNKT